MHLDCLKILFADDNLETRAIFEIGFRLVGHEVWLAADGAEAIAAVAERDFDVAVIDLEMPVVDGWQAIRAIRETEKGRHLPIVILSAYYTVAYEERVRCEQVDMVLSKPIIPSQLAFLLQNLVVHKSQKQSPEI